MSRKLNLAAWCCACAVGLILAVGVVTIVATVGEFVWRMFQ